MLHRLPPLNSLRALEVVSRHSSFREAAKELHVTAAAVGQQIKSLEDQIGRKLLRRHSAGYVLTNEALAAVPDLRTAFDRLSAAANTLSQGSRRVLTVTVVPSLAAMWLVPRLHEFERQYPDIDLLLHSSEVVVNLDTGGVDLALRYGSGVYAGAESTRLFEGELFPVCSPRLAAGPPRMKTPADLRGKPLVHVDWRPAHGVWPDWSAWLKAAGVDTVDPRKGLRFSDDAMAIQAAIAGRGVVLTSAALARDHLAARRLVRPFKVSVATGFAYYIVCPEERAQDAAVTAFRDWVLAKASE